MEGYESIHPEVYPEVYPEDSIVLPDFDYDSLIEEDDADEESSESFLNLSYSNAPSQGASEHCSIKKKLAVNSSDGKGSKRTKSSTTVHSSKRLKQDFTLPVHPAPHKFRFKINFAVKNFKGQKQGDQLGSLEIDHDDVDSILQEIWKYALKHLQHEVTLEISSEASCSSSIDYTINFKDSKPCFDDFDKFVIIHDKIAKRHYISSALLPALLHGWLDKEINVILLRYSVTVSTSQIWERVKAKLYKPKDTDRAGAPSNIMLSEMKQQLKTMYAAQYVSADINWSIWASYILKKSEQERQHEISLGPPHFLIHLFRSAPLHPDTILQKSKAELLVAKNVVDFFANGVSALRESYNNFTMQLDSRITILEQKANEFKTMLSSMEKTITPVESSFSINLAKEIPDCIDVDHL